jgi:hypothetical protein
MVRRSANTDLRRVNLSPTGNLDQELSNRLDHGQRIDHLFNPRQLKDRELPERFAILTGVA